MVIDSLKSGGKERRLVELLKGFKKMPDVECELIILSKRIHYQAVYDQEIKIHIIERFPSQDPRTFYKIYKICKKFRPDIIQNWDSMSALFVIPAVKIFGIKLINAMIVSAPPKLAAFSKLNVRSKVSFPFADVILANSKAGLEAFNVTEKGHYIHNGIEIRRGDDLLPSERIREKFGIITPKVVGMISSFYWYKDYITYLNAAQEILAIRSDITFLCIGDGKEFKNLKGEVKEQFKDKIIFTGVQKDVESIINIFDVGVLTSFMEGVPNALMECMLLSKPIVASAVGGVSELIIDGETGFLIGINAKEVLIEKITFLLDNQDVAIEMGKAGRARVVEEFSLNKMTDNFMNLYQKLLK